MYKMCYVLEHKAPDEVFKELEKLTHMLQTSGESRTLHPNDEACSQSLDPAYQQWQDMIKGAACEHSKEYKEQHPDDA